MTILLGIDLETTGLDPEADRIIEVGAVLWNSVLQKPIECFSSLIRGPVVSQEITDLTGISQAMLNFSGRESRDVWGNFCRLLDYAEFTIAHNAEFERSFFRQCNAGAFAFIDSARPWVDTMTDLPYPPGKGKGSLNEIAMAHGVVNVMPHRALPDALAMMQILSQYDFAEVERRAKTPTITLVAQVSFDDKDKAKALGYRWNRDNDKCWTKRIKDFDLANELEAAEKAGFTAVISQAVEEQKTLPITTS